MSEPSSPVNGQNRVVEGLVTTAGAAGYRKGTNAEAVTGSSYNALDQVVTLGTTPIVGALTETAPGTDTASSGLNGRLQRIAQNITTLIAKFTVGAGTEAAALRVTLPTDGTGKVGLNAGTNAIGKLAANSGVDIGDVDVISSALPTGAATAALQGGGLPAALGAGGGLKAEGVGTAGTPAGGVVTIQGGNATLGAVHIQVDGYGGYSGADGVGTVGAPYIRGQATVGTGAPMVVVTELFNGTSWDRQRANTNLTLLASAARIATTSSADQTNYNGLGALIVIDVTAITASPSLVVTVEAKDALSGKYVTLLTSAAITGVSTVQLAVYPGVTAAANLAASMILPRTWRVTVTAADADSATYSVGASVIL